MERALRAEIVRRLESLGVVDVPLPGRDDRFSSLVYRGKEFAHFHDDGELDLRLGRAVIEREGLVHPSDSRVHPNRSHRSPWIEIRFTNAADADEVVRLVRLAIVAP